MSIEMKPVPPGSPTFLGAPPCVAPEALEADIAIIGVPFSSPYDMLGSVCLCGSAPAAVRQASMRLVPMLAHHNFDFAGPILGRPPLRIVDCGDVAMRPGAYDANREAATDAVRAILRRGATPVILGGDHGVTIPALGAYGQTGSLCVVQVDAHLDWREEIHGVRFGQSSPMRRASEMAWVASMIQIGLRGAGSAREEEVVAARDFGSVLITADELHKVGMDEVLRRLPPAEHYYITIDIDGLDPAIAPGTGFPMFGGLSYYQTTDLLRGVAARGRVAGLDIVEIAPGLDSGGMTSFLAAQLILNMIGALVQSGQLGERRLS